MTQKPKTTRNFLLLLMVLLLLAGCSQAGEQPTAETANDPILHLPPLAAAETNGEPLQVVATTSIIGDVVGQVGGDTITLTTLIEPGQDPHSYEPAARDMVNVSNADVIFVNGWDLEEGLASDLQNIAPDAPIVPISAGIVPQEFGDGADDDHGHGAIDPHVWFNIQNVNYWVANVAQVLTVLDPDNGVIYEQNAENYLAELEEMALYAAEQIAIIPPEQRLLVTNHEAFGYFADAYGFQILGTVLPGSSTLAEPSADDLASLITTMEAAGLCTIFTETTFSDEVAQTVAAELSNCDDVQVRPLYTGSLGPPGSGAESYLGMFKVNVDTIVAGLTD